MKTVDTKARPLRAHVEEFLEVTPQTKRYTPDTIITYGHWLTGYLEWLDERGETDLSAFESTRLLEYSNALITAREYRPSTINSLVATFRTFGAWLLRMGRLPTNPAMVLETVRLDEPQRTVATDAEVFAMLSACEHIAEESERALASGLMAALAYTALRYTELLSLRVEDFRVADRSLMVVRGKGGKRREIPLCQPAFELLQRYVAARGVCQHDRLFAYNAESPVGRRTLNHVILRLKEIAHIPASRRLTVHSFRHSLATRLLARGVDVATISAILGHARVSTTLDIYCHTDSARVAKAIQFAVASPEEVAERKVSKAADPPSAQKACAAAESNRAAHLHTAAPGLRRAQWRRFERTR